jgi:hypothetical protein
LGTLTCIFSKSRIFRQDCRFQPAPFVVVVKARKGADQRGDKTMTQYLLAVHHVAGEAAPTEEEMQLMFKKVGEFNEKLQASGSWVFAGGLYPTDRSTTVRVKGDDTFTTDGPFAETKEQIGGFWVIEAPDLDDALVVAREAALACNGPVEVRPFEGTTKEEAKDYKEAWRKAWDNA